MNSLITVMLIPPLTIIFLAAVSGVAECETAPAKSEPLRAGMIGLDTSHVPAFTRTLNNPAAAADLSGIRVVAGYPGGTDFPASRDRVKGFTDQLRGMGVEIVDNIPELLAKVDVVMLESVDGRIHLEEARQVIRAGKPLFIDKPVAGSLTDAIVIYELAREAKVPVFSSSSIRYSEAVQRARASEQIGEVIGCSTWGPLNIQPGTPDLFFYGIHGVEALFTVLGTGCESVVRVATDSADLVSGTWRDGRIGSYRGIKKGKTEIGGVVFGSKGIVPMTAGSGYDELLRQVVRFFKTGASPVAPDETLEVLAFMEAADLSKRRGGGPVTLASVMEQARAQAMRKLSDPRKGG